MSTWRVIITDTESMTGVAPVCESPEHATWAAKGGAMPGEALPEWVFECCPHPHIETWSEDIAAHVSARLTDADADLCS